MPAMVADELEADVLAMVVDEHDVPAMPNEPVPPTPPPTICCRVCKKDLSHISTQKENIRRHEDKCEGGE